MSLVVLYVVIFTARYFHTRTPQGVFLFDGGHDMISNDAGKHFTNR